MKTNLKIFITIIVVAVSIFTSSYVYSSSNLNDFANKKIKLRESNVIKIPRFIHYNEVKIFDLTADGVLGPQNTLDFIDTSYSSGEYFAEVKRYENLILSINFNELPEGVEVSEIPVKINNTQYQLTSNSVNFTSNDVYLNIKLGVKLLIDGNFRTDEMQKLAYSVKLKYN